MSDPENSRGLYVMRWRRKDGSTVWSEQRHVPIFNDEGQRMSVIGIVRDITERHEVDEQLRKLSRAVEQSSVSITITDADGRIEYVNPRFTQLTGFSFENVLGQEPRILNPENKQQSESQQILHTLQTGIEWRGELRNVTKTGTPYWESGIISPIHDNQGQITHFLAVMEDITQRKQQERERETILSVALALRAAKEIEDDRAIRGAVVDILDMEGFRVVSAENGIVGVKLAREEHPALIVCDIMMPYLDGYGVITQLRKHAETATIPFIFLTARTTQNDIRQGMNLGADDYLTKPFRAEELIRTIQARLERQARLAEKLQERVNDLQSNLMHVLPHELNTPLHGILAGVEFLKDEYSTLAPSDIEELLWIIHQSALRMRRLVANSLLHADLGLQEMSSENAPQDQTTEPTPVAFAIQQIAEQEAAAVARETDVRLQLEDAMLPILPNHLSKIVEEILNNAFKYSNPNTPVEITSYREGEAWRLTVKDHGRGMSEQEIAAISAFRQFQRKQYEQQGLGLGLAIVQRLLELYKGKLTIESVQGEYTTVKIMVPLATAADSPRA